MSFRLVPKLVTLNDLGRRNGPYFALFQRTCVRCRRKTTGRKNDGKSPSAHHRTNLSGYICAIKACIDNLKKPC